ncbi:hypothetical protein EES43_26670 [Streptomyces sp. ADI96-02]|nr:hypothetical protein EES43_26670 [Streptomyces sp. ADI96-02]
MSPSNGSGVHRCRSSSSAVTDRKTVPSRANTSASASMTPWRQAVDGPRQRAVAPHPARLPANLRFRGPTLRPARAHCRPHPRSPGGRHHDRVRLHLPGGRHQPPSGLHRPQQVVAVRREYEEPTAQEWRDFLAHFELRKVALGVCARDFDALCVHEYARIRCFVLRSAPVRTPRPEEIHVNLLDRLREAEEQEARRGRGDPGRLRRRRAASLPPCMTSRPGTRPSTSGCRTSAPAPAGLPSTLTAADAVRRRPSRLAAQWPQARGGRISVISVISVISAMPAAGWTSCMVITSPGFR